MSLFFKSPLDKRNKSWCILVGWTRRVITITKFNTLQNSTNFLPYSIFGEYINYTYVVPERDIRLMYLIIHMQLLDSGTNILSPILLYFDYIPGMNSIDDMGSVCRVWQESSVFSRIIWKVQINIWFRIILDFMAIFKSIIVGLIFLNDIDPTVKLGCCNTFSRVCTTTNKG